MCSSACSEKVNSRVYLESVDAMQMLQIMGPNYHAHFKYFGITNEVVFGIKKIVQLCNFQIMYSILQ